MSVKPKRKYGAPNRRNPVASGLTLPPTPELNEDFPGKASFERFETRKEEKRKVADVRLGDAFVFDSVDEGGYGMIRISGKGNAVVEGVCTTSKCEEVKNWTKSSSLPAGVTMAQAHDLARSLETKIARSRSNAKEEEASDSFFGRLLSIRGSRKKRENAAAAATATVAACLEVGDERGRMKEEVVEGGESGGRVEARNARVLLTEEGDWLERGWKEMPERPVPAPRKSLLAREEGNNNSNNKSERASSSSSNDKATEEMKRCGKGGLRGVSVVSIINSEEGGTEMMDNADGECRKFAEKSGPQTVVEIADEKSTREVWSLSSSEEEILNCEETSAKTAGSATKEKKPEPPAKPFREFLKKSCGGDIESIIITNVKTTSEDGSKTSSAAEKKILKNGDEGGNSFEMSAAESKEERYSWKTSTTLLEEEVVLRSEVSEERNNKYEEGFLKKMLLEGENSKKKSEAVRKVSEDRKNPKIEGPLKTKLSQQDDSEQQQQCLRKVRDDNNLEKGSPFSREISEGRNDAEGGYRRKVSENRAKMGEILEKSSEMEVKMVPEPAAAATIVISPYEILKKDVAKPEEPELNPIFPATAAKETKSAMDALKSFALCEEKAGPPSPAMPPKSPKEVPSVVLRKKCVGGSGSEEPELMKVFARRSLKLKECDAVEFAASDISPSNDKENEDGNAAAVATSRIAEEGKEGGGDIDKDNNKEVFAEAKEVRRSGSEKCIFGLPQSRMKFQRSISAVESKVAPTFHHQTKPRFKTLSASSTGQDNDDDNVKGPEEEAAIPIAPTALPYKCLKQRKEEWERRAQQVKVSQFH